MFDFIKRKETEANASKYSGENGIIDEQVFSVLLKGKTESFVVSEFPSVMGRNSEDADVPIFGYSISRSHCKLVEEDRHVYVQDLNSTMGTMVDGVMLQPDEKVELVTGQILTIGEEKLEVEIHYPKPKQAEMPKVPEREVRFEEKTAEIPVTEEIPTIGECESQRIRITEEEFNSLPGVVLNPVVILPEMSPAEDVVSVEPEADTTSKDEVTVCLFGDEPVELEEQAEEPEEPETPEDGEIVETIQELDFAEDDFIEPETDEEEMIPDSEKTERIENLNDGEATEILEYSDSARSLPKMRLRWKDEETGEEDAFFLDKNPFRVGRSETDTEHSIKAKGVSKHHCYFTRIGLAYYVHDMASTNGVLLNGDLITPNRDIRIQNGDQITIGTRTYIFECVKNA